MSDKLRVATVAGSNIETVQRIFRELGAELIVVKNVEAAQTIAFDRLLLLGGPDISPFWYGEPHNGCKKINIQRDFIEWALVRRALQGMWTPTLGICRGMQMLAVAAGGALMQDMKKNGFGEHPRSEDYEVCHALYTVEPFLAKHLPHRKPETGVPAFVEVNSTHHQAISFMPFGFEIAALAHDDTIEAIYLNGMLGVQWHPEKLVETDERWMKLFRWFMEGLA